MRWDTNGAIARAGMIRLKPPIQRLGVLEAGMRVPFGVSARRQPDSEWGWRSGGIEDYVVAPGSVCEVLAGVVDHRVGAYRSDQV
jgi:hypothetical protein